MSKTHVIDGTYVEAHRVAKRGEKVLIVNEFSPEIKKPYKNGDVFTCYDSYDGGNSFSFIIAKERTNTRIYFPEYVVLEPVDQAPASTADLPSNDAILETIANLVRRVHSLEQQIRDTQNNVERQGVEIAELEHELSEKASDIDRLYNRSDIDSIANEIAKMVRRGGC